MLKVEYDTEIVFKCWKCGNKYTVETNHKYIDLVMEDNTYCFKCYNKDLKHHIKGGIK